MREIKVVVIQLEPLPTERETAENILLKDMSGHPYTLTHVDLFHNFGQGVNQLHDALYKEKETVDAVVIDRDDLLRLLQKALPAVQYMDKHGKEIFIDWEDRAQDLKRLISRLEPSKAE